MSVDRGVTCTMKQGFLEKDFEKKTSRFERLIFDRSTKWPRSLDYFIAKAYVLLLKFISFKTSKENFF